MLVAQITVDIKAQGAQATAQIEAIAKQVQALGGTFVVASDKMKTAHTTGLTLTNMFSNMVVAIGIYGLVGGIQRLIGNLEHMAIAFAKSSIQLGINRERLEANMTFMLKSKQAAREFLNELEDFALLTPFEFEWIGPIGQQLLSAGMAAEKVIPLLRAIGDTAAGQKNPLMSFNEMVQIMTDNIRRIYSGGRVGVAIQELSRFGITVDRIAAKTGIAANEITKGYVKAFGGDTQKLLTAIIDIMEERYGGQMEATRGLTDQVLSSIMDSWHKFGALVGRGVLDVLTPKLFDFQKRIVELDKAGEFKNLQISLTSVLLKTGQFGAALIGLNPDKIITTDDSIKAMVKSIESL